MARTADSRLALDAPEHAGTLKGAAGRKHCTEPHPASELVLVLVLGLDLVPGLDLGLRLGSPIALAPRRWCIHGLLRKWSPSAGDSGLSEM